MATDPPPDYRRAILQARERQIRLTERNAARLMRTYQAARRSILTKLEDVTSDMSGRVTQAALHRILAEIDDSIAQLQAAMNEALRGGMLATAQAAADRERAIASAAGLREIEELTQPTIEETLRINGRDVVVRYSGIAQDAVEALAARYYSDGITLSERLGTISDQLRRGIEDEVMRAVIAGEPVADLARRLRSGPLRSDAIPARRASLIARTEMAHAYTEGHLRSIRDTGTGTWRDGITGVKWQLSVSHPKPDICDLYATFDEGYGPGVYHSTPVPLDHPNGLCYTTTIVARMPETAEWTAGEEPRPDEVPEAEIAWHARRGDVVARQARVIA